MYGFLMIVGIGSIAYGIKLWKDERLNRQISDDGNPQETTKEEKPVTTEEVKPIAKEVREESAKEEDDRETAIEDYTSISIPDEELIHFNKILEMELEKPEKVENKSKSIQIDEENKRNVIKGIEKGEYSVEEACNILGMEKGEVLLLKNIYRNY